MPKKILLADDSITIQKVVELTFSDGDYEVTAVNNGAKAVDFVSEDDVRRAIQKGEKIYITARTIITPAARDMGEPAEVFAKI